MVELLNWMETTGVMMTVIELIMNPTEQEDVVVCIGNNPQITQITSVERIPVCVEAATQHPRDKHGGQRENLTNPLTTKHGTFQAKCVWSSRACVWEMFLLVLFKVASAQQILKIPHILVRPQPAKNISCVLPSYFFHNVAPLFSFFYSQERSVESAVVTSALPATCFFLWHWKKLFKFNFPW